MNGTHNLQKRAIINRRQFFTVSALATSTGVMAQRYSDYSKDPRPEVAEGAWTAGGPDGPVFSGPPVVSGPSADALCILQPVQRLATGHVEIAIDGAAWQPVETDEDGFAPLSAHVLKFRLPPLPAGKTIRYRVVAHTAGWVKVRQFYHGELKVGAPQTGPETAFRTLDASADSTTFVVWNDTHEDSITVTALHALTRPVKPDFLLWNGDQSNDVHFESQMAAQFLAPEGLAIAAEWPLAYVRGNHDVRGPAAKFLPDFTGTPDDRFYYAFRSGPVAALVLDTGEDRPDSRPELGGRAHFEKMQTRQAMWLANVVKEPWFREAPHKVMFCHIPLWLRKATAENKNANGSVHCRKLWLPILTAAGVKLIIAGHTHRHAWMPAHEHQPIAQLIGGGPSPQSATFIQITATKTGLKADTRSLDGKVLTEFTLPA